MKAKTSGSSMALDHSERPAGLRIREAVLQSMGRAILAGDYQPGETLPGEIVHANELDVSRGVYREVVQALIAKGLVESRPKTGTRVLPRQRWNMLDPDVLAWAFAGTPDMRLLRSLFELREAIEPFAARLAAERRTEEDLRIMDQALLDMDRLTLATPEGQAADRRFHETILAASDNDALIALSSGIAAGVEWSTRFKQRTRALPRDPVPDHRLVHDAIAARDAAAAAHHMTTLVRQAFDDTWFGMSGTARR